MLSQTIIIIIFTALTSIIAFNNQKVYGDLIMYPPAVNKGQYYRLLTSGFIHADFNHLIFNMLTLYFFGRTVEDAMGTIIGKYGFLALYLGGIIVSDIPSYLKNRANHHYASLGASGGVSAVVFSFIMFAPGHGLHFHLYLPLFMALGIFFIVFIWEKKEVMALTMTPISGELYMA